MYFSIVENKCEHDLIKCLCTIIINLFKVD